MARADRQSKRKKGKDTSSAGPEWFNIKSDKNASDPKVQRELRLLQLRSVLDSKQHYKRFEKEIPKVFQIGEIIDNPLDHYSTRITRKDRKKGIIDSLLDDAQARKQYKQKYNEIQRAKNLGKKKFYVQKGHNTKARSKKK